MKILSHNPPSPEPQPVAAGMPVTAAPEARAPQEDLKGQMKTLLHEFAEHALNDMHALEDKLEQSQARAADQMVKHNQTIARIIEEIGELKRALSERPEPPAPAMTQPPSAPPPSEPPRPDPMIPEAINTITREIGRLNSEMGALRKTLLELKPVEPVKAAPEPVKVPEPVRIAAEPAEIPLEPIKHEPVPHSILLDDLAGSLLSAEREGKKVAFFTKVWDYLNTVAIEIPLGKQNH